MLTFEKTMPEEVGIPSGCILNFVNRLKRQEVPMHSFLLMRHDKLIAEGYYAPCKADTLHRMFSISKSFTSIAIGLLADEGKLSLDDPIVKYFPDKVPEDVHPWIAAMTIRDMLMMRTCHASTTYKLDMASDWVESFFTVPPTHPSGKFFHYDTSSAHTLCALAERLSGMPMLDYLRKKLAPLGLSDASYMITDPFGVSMGGSGLVATSMDLLKFGYFIFHKGEVDGQQLLSASYIETATSHLTDTLVTAPVRSEACGYGYQFWRNERGGYVCYGMGGQLIIFLPDYDMICVTTADTQGIGGGNQLIYDALYDEILPCISDAPLPLNTGSSLRYQDAMQGLRLAPLRGNTASPLMDALSDVRWQVVESKSENAAGFSSMGIAFSEDKFVKNGFSDSRFHVYRFTESKMDIGSLFFTLNGTDYSFDFGLGSFVTGKFPIYDMNYAASGVWLSEDTLYIKVHIIDAYVGSVHFEICFGEKDATVFMRKQFEGIFQEFQGHLYCVAEPRR